MSKKVLLLIPSMAGVGGTERMVHRLSGLLRSAGLEVHQASFDAPDSPRHFADEGPFHALGPIPRLPLLLRPLAYAKAASRLRKLKRELGIGLSISNLWGADLVSVLSGGADRKLALCHINVVGNQSNRLMMRFIRLVRSVYGRFDKLVAVSESLASELKDLYRLPSDRITHIDNFTDPQDVCGHWPADGRPWFTWCGRFSHEKNVEGLLAAWAAFAPGCPEAKLFLVGDGPDRAGCEDLARRLGLRTGGLDAVEASQVVFTGQQRDPAEFIAPARAFLLSSRVEGLPMVVLEALSSGVPVLAADCPAGGVRRALKGCGTCEPLRDAAEHTPAGTLLPVPDSTRPGMIEAWRAALVVAASDESMLRHWREGAKERAALFDSNAARDRWTAVLGSLGATP